MVRRKNDHIALCLEQDVESRAASFDLIGLEPEAVPEFALADVDPSVEFLGRRFDLPLLITGMTGGVDRGRLVNGRLARVAAAWGIPMGLGSLKMMVASPERRALFDVKREVPGVFLIGNLGLNGFNYGITADDVRRLVDELGLDAMAFHVNALQEAIQPEGESNFRDLLVHLQRLCRVLPCPVMVKEVGSGMSAATVLRLAQTGVAAIDVGGASGTSWGFIEGCRGSSGDRRLGEVFRNWGLSTVHSLAAAADALGVHRRVASNVVATPVTDPVSRVQDRHVGDPLQGASPSKLKPREPVASEPAASGGYRRLNGQAPALVATGGIRNGLQVAKAVACGATMVGVGLPLLRAALSSSSQDAEEVSGLNEELDFFARGLRIALFACGARSLADLPQRAVVPDSLSRVRAAGSVFSEM